MFCLIHENESQHVNYKAISYAYYWILYNGLAQLVNGNIYVGFSRIILVFKIFLLICKSKKMQMVNHCIFDRVSIEFSTPSKFAPLVSGLSNDAYAHRFELPKV